MDSARRSHYSDVASEHMGKFKQRLLRTKTIISQSSVDEDPQGGGGGYGLGQDSGSTSTGGVGELKKVLTTFDLISLGVGSCCGTGMYVVAGLVAKNVAGPAVIFSFIIAAIASILSGVCYAEFGVRVPKTSGSAYMYSYVTVGEFVAFLIGWNLILEYMIGSAAGASALSACFDALTNHTMSAYLEENVGTVIGKTYPDFLGFFIGVAMTVVLAFGVQKSVRLNNVLNAVNFIIWVFIVVTGLFYVRVDNWSAQGFAPEGASGVFSGAATCFYAFIGFDIIATTGEEARSPSRSIPIAIVSSLVVCLVAYVSVSMILTLMVPVADIEGDSALIDMFVQRGFAAAKYVVAVGSISALTVSLFGSMFPMPRVIYAMSRDGLLFEQLSHVSTRTGTPLLATIITGLLASLMALLVGLRILVEMMSIGTLLAYTLVSVSVLILRYQPDKCGLPIPLAHQLDVIAESPEGAESDDVFDDPANQLPSKRQMKDDACLISPTGERPQKYGTLPFSSELFQSKMAMVKRHGKIWWLRLGFPSDDMMPNDRTARTVIFCVGIMGITELILCVLIVFGEEYIINASWWALILLLLLIAAVIACVLIIMRQPQNIRKLRFMSPGVPVLPCLATFFNIYLMLKLPALTWARLGVWILIGVLLYFSYSMVHSVKERKQKAQEADEKKAKEDVEQNALDESITKLPENDLDAIYGNVQDRQNKDLGPALPGGPPLRNEISNHVPNHEGSPLDPGRGRTRDHQGLPKNAARTKGSRSGKEERFPRSVAHPRSCAPGSGSYDQGAIQYDKLVRDNVSEGHHVTSASTDVNTGSPRRSSNPFHSDTSDSTSPASSSSGNPFTAAIVAESGPTVSPGNPFRSSLADGHDSKPQRRPYSKRLEDERDPFAVEDKVRNKPNITPHNMAIARPRPRPSSRPAQGNTPPPFHPIPQRQREVNNNPFEHNDDDW